MPFEHEALHHVRDDIAFKAGIVRSLAERDFGRDGA